MTVDETRKAVGVQRRIELVCEFQVIATVGDKDVKLALVGRRGLARLRRGTGGLTNLDRMRHVRDRLT